MEKNKSGSSNVFFKVLSLIEFTAVFTMAAVVVIAGLVTVV